MTHRFTHRGYTFYYSLEEAHMGVTICAPTGTPLATISATTLKDVKTWIKRAKLSNELDNLLDIYGFERSAAQVHPIG